MADGDDSEYPGLSHLLNSVSDPLDDFDQMAFGVCDDVDETVEFDVGRRRPRKSPQKRRRSVRLVDDEAVADGDDDSDDRSHISDLDLETMDDDRRSDNVDQEPDGECVVPIHDDQLCKLCFLGMDSNHEQVCPSTFGLDVEFYSDREAHSRVVAFNEDLRSKLTYGSDCVSDDQRREHDRQKVAEHLSSGVSCQLEVDPDLLKSFRTCTCGGNLSVPVDRLCDLRRRGHGDDPRVLICDKVGCDKKYGSFEVIRRVLVDAYSALGVPENEVPYMDAASKRASLVTRPDGSVDHGVESKLKQNGVLNRTFEVRSAASGFELMFPTDRESTSVVSTTDSVNTGVWNVIDRNVGFLSQKVCDLIGGYVQEGMHEDRVAARVRALNLSTSVISNQMHDPLHRSSCFTNKKDKECECRYNFPEASVEEGGVSIVFRDESGEVEHVLVSYTRGPAFLYFANTSMFLHKLADLNTFTKMILSMDITYYVTKYTSKVQESAKILYEKVYSSVMAYKKRCESMTRSTTADGFGRVYSALNALTQCETVSSTMAAWLNVNNQSRFAYAFEDVRVPVSAFVDHLVSGVLQTSLSKNYEIMVLTYLFRPNVFEKLSPIEFYLYVEVVVRKTPGYGWYAFRTHSKSGDLMCRRREHPVTLTMYCGQLLDVGKLGDDSSMDKSLLCAARERTAGFLLAMGTSYRSRTEFNLTGSLWDLYNVVKLRTENSIRPLSFFRNMLNQSRTFVRDGSKNIVRDTGDAPVGESPVPPVDLIDPELGSYEFGIPAPVRIVKDPDLASNLVNGCGKTPLIKETFRDSTAAEPLSDVCEEYVREIDRMVHDGPVRFADVNTNKGMGEDQFLPGLAGNTKPDIFLEKVTASLVVRPETLDIRYFEDPVRCGAQEDLKDVDLDRHFTCFLCYGSGHVASACDNKPPPSKLPSPNTVNGPPISQHSHHWGLNEGQHGAFCLFALAVLNVALARNSACFDPGNGEDTVGERELNPVEEMIDRLNKSGYTNRADLPGITDYNWEYSYRSYQHCRTVRCVGLGGPGRGKSYLIRAVLDYARAWGVLDSVVIASTSGSSALIVRGCTGQKSFDANRDFKMYNVNKASCNEFYAIKGIYILDEAGRFNGQQFQAFELCCRKARGSDLPFGGMNFFALGDLAQSILFSRGMFTTTDSCRAIDDPGLNMFRYIFNCGFELVADERCKSADVTARNDRLACNMMTVDDLKEYNKLCTGHFPPRASVAPCVVAVGSNLEAHRMCRRVQVDYLAKNPIADCAEPGGWRARGVIMIEADINLHNGSKLDDDLRERVRRVAPRAAGLVSPVFFAIIGERNVVMTNQDVGKGVGKGAGCVVVDVVFRSPESSCVYFRATDGLGGGVHCVSAKDVRAVTMKSLDPYYSTRFYFGGPYEHARYVDKSDRVKGLLRGEFPLLIKTAQSKILFKDLRKAPFDFDVCGVPSVPGHALVGDFTQGMTLDALYLFSVRNATNNDGLINMLMSRVRNPRFDLRMGFKLSENVNVYKPRVAYMKEMNRLRQHLFDRTGLFLCTEKLTGRRYLSKSYDIPLPVVGRVSRGTYEARLKDPYLEQIRQHLKLFELRLNKGRLVDVKSGWTIVFKFVRPDGIVATVRVVVESVVLVTHSLEEALQACDLADLLPDCASMSPAERLSYAKTTYLKLYRNSLIAKWGLKLLKIRVEGHTPVKMDVCSVPVAVVVPLVVVPVVVPVVNVGVESETKDPGEVLSSPVGCWIGGDDIDHENDPRPVVSRCQRCFAPESSCAVGDPLSFCAHRMFTGGIRGRRMGDVSVMNGVSRISGSRIGVQTSSQPGNDIPRMSDSRAGIGVGVRVSVINGVGRISDSRIGVQTSSQPDNAIPRMSDSRAGIGVGVRVPDHLHRVGVHDNDSLCVSRRSTGFVPYPVIDINSDPWNIGEHSTLRCVCCGDPVVDCNGAPVERSSVRLLMCPCCRLDGFWVSRPIGRKRCMVVNYTAQRASCLSMVSPVVVRDELYSTLLGCSRERYGSGVGTSVIDWTNVGMDCVVAEPRWIECFDKGRFFNTSIVALYLEMVGRHFSSDRSRTYVADFMLWDRLVQDNFDQFNANTVLPRDFRVFLRASVGKANVKSVRAKELRRLLVPVRIKEGPHFWLLVVDFLEGFVFVFDSSSRLQPYGARVIGIDRLQALIGTSFPTHVVSCNQQTDSDCGVHVCVFAWVACIGVRGLNVGTSRSGSVVCVNANTDGRCSIYAAGDVLTYSLQSTVDRFECFVESRRAWMRRQVEVLLDGSLGLSDCYQTFVGTQDVSHLESDVAVSVLQNRWLSGLEDEVNGLDRVNRDILELFSTRVWRGNRGASSGADTFGSFVSHVLSSRGYVDIVVGQVNVNRAMPYEVTSITDVSTFLDWVELRGGILSPQHKTALSQNKLVLFVTVDNGHWHSVVPTYLLHMGKIGCASHPLSGYSVARSSESSSSPSSSSSSHSSSSSSISSLPGAIDTLMSTWWLDAVGHRNRILGDLVTGVLFYSSIAGSYDGRDCRYMGLVRSDLSGTNALLQFLVSCVPPWLYGGIRESSSGLYGVMSRLMVPSTVNDPSIEVNRAVRSFFVEHRPGLHGDDVGAVLRKFDYLISLCGPRVQKLFTTRLCTECCSASVVHPGGLRRLCGGEDWSQSTWCDIQCECGRSANFAVDVPPECLIVRPEGGTLTAPPVLNLGDRAVVGGRRPLVFDLKAAILRTSTGRYVCCANRSRLGALEGGWYQFDDEVVEATTVDDVSCTTGVLLMVYIQRGLQTVDERRRECMGIVDVHWKPSRLIPVHVGDPDSVL